MAQIINTNIPSINAQRNLNSSQSSLATSLERLSSGLRINSAKDDAAGLAISERFTTQIRGLNQAVRNANDGISFSQVAEGALGTVGDALQRIRELSIQAINDTNSASDRQALNNEVQQLIAEVSRVSSSTEFNGQRILDGSLNDLVFQVGANRNQTITVSGVDARAGQLGAAVYEGNTISLSDITTNNALTSDGFPAITAGELGAITVNGVAVDLSEVTSLDQVVTAINGVFGDTEVQAARSVSVTTDEIAIVPPTASSGDTALVEINGVSVSYIEGTDDLESFVGKINDRSTQTGVTATLNAGGTAFTLSSNNDINVKVLDDGATTDVFTFDGLVEGDSESYIRGLELTSEVGKEISVAGASAGLLELSTDFNSVAIETIDLALNTVDITTGKNATDALQILDLALQQVNGLRAELGAVQTRFESTISNLSVTAENLTASRSRIQDADFAAETANLTRAQILQQAGTSVLAQANAIPQNVLNLLG